MLNRIKKASMQDIADYVGVSKNTVSLALNNKPGVSDKRRAEISQAARILHYGGVGMTPEQDQDNVVVLAPSYVVEDRQFYPEIIWEVEQAARQQGWSTVLTNVTETMQTDLTLPAPLSDSVPRGVILLGVMPAGYVAQILAADLRVIHVDTYDVDAPCHSVVTDNLLGSRQITRYLQAQGHRKIGFIGPIQRTTSFFERWMGFHYAMQDQGFSINLEHCLLDGRSYVVDETEVSAFLEALPSWPTAWFCANDRMAITLIHALSARGMRVPDDISVAGFDDTDAAVQVLPKLTTVHVRRDLLASEAIRMLSTLDKVGTPSLKIAIAPELVVRDSIGSCPVLVGVDDR